MSKMTIMFECDNADFGVIMGAIGPKMSLITNFQAESQNEKKARTRQATTAPKPTDNKSRYRNSRVFKVLQNTLEAAGATGASILSLQHALVREGFSPNSQSPATSYMIADGLVKKLPNANFVLTKFATED